MEVFEAKILLKNLLKRIRKVDEIGHELVGLLTDDELQALQIACALLEAPQLDTSSLSSNDPLQVRSISQRLESSVQEVSDELKSKLINDSHSIEPVSANHFFIIDKSVTKLSKPPIDRRLCFDFGTAMSKVTLVKDFSSKRGFEVIDVLELGVPGDQEEISENMLVSSVFIDGEGLMWFGQSAVKRSALESQDGSRQRLDNIKRYLSEEGMKNKVLSKFNPTEIEVTYGDMVLAYLMYLTWTVNQCLESKGEPRNLYRRFAMPCFVESKARDTAQILRVMLGEAQILADTFNQTLQSGIPIGSFRNAIEQLREECLKVDFVIEEITEPLGVAGSIMSWNSHVNSLVMIVDVGAGTSDFSLYRMHFDENSGKSIALEVENSSSGITEAGNHLDGLLRGLILKKAGIDSNHEHWVNILGNLELDLRDYKERLFSDRDVVVRLFNEQMVLVSLDEFILLEQVVKFGDSLKKCRDDILRRVDQSFIKGAPNGALGVILTGGGANLPMVRSLAEGMVSVNNVELRLVKAQVFPKWLKEDYPDLEDSYPRIAVSLGGARKRIIDRSGVARITAGDIKGKPVLDGYYTKG